MKLPAAVVKLPVRVRRTLISADAAERALLVHCPVNRASCSLERCRECDRCDGLSMDADGIRHVLCRVDEAPHPTRKIMPTAAEVTPVGALMSGEVVCVSASLKRGEAIALFLDRGLSGAPVVDDAGRPLGMLTRSDLLGAAIEKPAPSTVADIMMPIAYTLAENDPLSRGAALMAAEGVHHLPVLGDQGRVVGLISTLDVTRWLARQAGYEV
ncbi:MAG TPA: CBS domain-containing protein [Polyangia bacterium]|nr:CBS domain-containing protein [Polyangia bacterium]